jgi:hypothetical protein
VQSVEVSFSFFFGFRYHLVFLVVFLLQVEEEVSPLVERPVYKCSTNKIIPPKLEITYASDVTPSITVLRPSAP